MLYNMLKKFHKSEEGGVIIIVTFSILVLFVAAGIAFDMARTQTAKVKLASCLDTAGVAALAKVAEVPPNTSVNDWVIQNVRKYFLADCQSGYLETAAVSFNGQNSINNVSVVLKSDLSTLTLDALVQEKTMLLPVIGVNTVTIPAHTVVTRSTNGMELVLVLDNTGSMNDKVQAGEKATKIDALKCALAGEAAHGGGTFCQKNNLITFGLLDILYGSSDSRPNLFAGLIAYRDMVNVGATKSPGIHFISNSLASNLSDCVDTRSSSVVSLTDPKISGDVPFTLDISDDPPLNRLSGAVDMFQALTKSEVTASDGSSYCPTAYQGWTMSKGALVNQIQKMSPNGNTFIHMGFAWGWRMLSPNWSGLWGNTPTYTVPGSGATLQVPLPYKTKGINKVVILMTDGINTVPTGKPSAYMLSRDQPFPGQYPEKSDPKQEEAQEKKALDDRTKAVCDAMKAKGITIFTIGFGQDSEVEKDVLSYCASPDTSPSEQHFLMARSNADLGKDFQLIGGELSNLLITQ